MKKPLAILISVAMMLSSAAALTQPAAVFLVAALSGVGNEVRRA